MDSETVLEPQNRSERTEIYVFRAKIIEKITKIKISETYAVVQTFQKSNFLEIGGFRND